ncbi:MAG: OmpA family protein, partial [Bacteroidota bacterium]|nr:OmpA family protein [Bacteroidota bacterium]
MNISKPTMAILSFCFMSSIFAQEVEQLTKKDSIVESYWLVTLGTNFVDDSGHEFNKLFDFQKAWNVVPYPSRLSFGRYFKNGLGLEAIASYNKYHEGKIVDQIEMADD